ncbi:dermonecrotic toxin domain-containing protein [Pseudomonas sp. NPDC087612]|uniref:dermonecrotic toxin domain-containing protein n=1 Tax=Pseudomonas sp. NPDC087612 TaxID=3364441 RepID=UPI0037F26B00
MSDLPEIPAPHSPVDFISVINHDTALLADASKRWKDHRDTFTTLLAQAPGVYQTLQDVVREQLGVDPLSTALRFRISDTHDSDVSLVALALHTRQYPQPPADLDQHARVTAQGPDHPTLRLTPTQLLARLAQLDLPAAVRHQWDRYWQARASDTAVSRRTHAQNQYLDIFKASWDVALATGKFDRQQQRAVKEVLDNPEWHSQQGIEIQTVAIDDQVMPGALLFKTEDEPQLMLYRPGSGFSTHASQADLEAAIGATASSVSYESHDSLSGGFSPLFNSLLNERLSALDFKPGEDIRQFGELALSMVHWVDTQQRSSSIFSLPPALESTDSEDASQRSFYDFGSLNLDIPYSIRLQQINTQRALMASIAETDLQALKDHQQTLGDACQQAEQAIEQQLKTDTWQQEQSPAANAALLQAHYHGLRAHARLQNLLGQIDNEELRWLESLLDQPDTFPRLGSRIVAAHPVLNTTSMDNGVQISTSTTLNDCLVVTLQDGDKPQSLLLYWPGEAGGLLRCANQAELTRCFAINDQSEQSLSLSPVTGDVLAVVLAHHLSQAKTALTTEEAPAAVKEALARRLQVPRHAAREYAFNLIQEQETSATLTGVSLNWLDKLSASDRAMLKAGTLGFIAAMHRAQALVARDLPHRELFCRQLISQRLKQDFPGYDDSPITLYLPESTSWVPIVVDSTSPQGIATKSTLKASNKWVDLTLDALLLDNIDEAMKERLSFLKLKLNTSNQALVQQLKDSIDKTYLSGLATDLDLAQQYENKITEAYRGTHESAFSRAYRRQCLGEPFRQMLIMHSAQARAKGELDDRGQTIFNIAIDADNKAAYQADGHDIELISARLSAGGKDTDSYGTTLSGVTFISDQNSGITVLYRPEHPTRLVRQYSSLEAARSGLYNLSKQSGEIDYLAGRALLGNPDAHRSRMRQAIEHRFDGIIGLGTTWPSTTSLAQHLLDAQGGRILEAHRATSRSNRDLWLENFAYQSGMIFNYIKMALGFIPVIGTVVAVYDFFDASARLVSALRQDEVYKALEALQQVLLAFVDAAIDLAPGLPLKALSARQLTRQRQLQLLQAGPAAGFAPGSARRLSRFEGWEYQTPLSLAGIEPGRHGKYKGIYQHAKGDFILVGDRPCQVQWLETEHTWRLRGTQFKTWRKNIALNENGQWDTHFALYGVHLLGGGAGGGQVLGHLADVLAPYWPAAIRERLPISWTDVRQRQYQRLLNKLRSDGEAFQLQTRRVNDKHRQGLAITEQEIEKDITDGLALYSTYEDFLALATRSNAQSTKDQMSVTAKMLTSRYHLRLNNAITRVESIYTEIENIGLELKRLAQGIAQTLAPDGTTGEAFYTLTRQLAQKRNQVLPLRRNILDALELMARHIDNMRTWKLKITRGIDRRDFISDIDRVTENLTPVVLNGLRIDQLKELISKPLSGFDLGWARLQEKLSAPRKRLDRMLYALSQLASVSHSRVQRSAILKQGIDELHAFKNNLRYWSISSDEYFDAAVVKVLESSLDDSINYYSRYLKTPTENLPTVQRNQPSSARVFQTTDDLYLIGTPTQQRNTYTLTGINGRDEIYTQGADGRFILQNPQTSAGSASQTSLSQSRSEARKFLDGSTAFRNKVDDYATQNLEPASLEDLMLKRADDLNAAANTIERLSPTDDLINELREAARQLVNDGRQLRVQQILQTKQPNGGHLEYLENQRGVVEIEKVGGLVELRKRPDGRPDFLQEYVIYDRTHQPRRTLWYAHFHYNKQKPRFAEFDKAHLKIPAQRKLGTEWQSSQIEEVQIWRGDLGRPLAERVFAHLF